MKQSEKEKKIMIMLNMIIKKKFVEIEISIVEHFPGENSYEKENEHVVRVSYPCVSSPALLPVFTCLHGLYFI